MPQPIKDQRKQIGTLAGVPTKPSRGRIRSEAYASSGMAGKASSTDYAKRDVARGDGASPGDRHTDIGGRGIAVTPTSMHGTGAKTTSDMANNRRNQL